MKKQVRQVITKYSTNKSGQAMVEYAIIAAFLVAAIIGVLHMYKSSMRASYKSVSDSRSGMMP